VKLLSRTKECRTERRIKRYLFFHLLLKAEFFKPHGFLCIFQIERIFHFISIFFMTPCLCLQRLLAPCTEKIIILPQSGSYIKLCIKSPESL